MVSVLFKWQGLVEGDRPSSLCGLSAEMPVLWMQTKQFAALDGGGHCTHVFLPPTLSSSSSWCSIVFGRGWGSEAGSSFGVRSLRNKDKGLILYLFNSHAVASSWQPPQLY